MPIINLEEANDTVEVTICIMLTPLQQALWKIP